MEVAIMVIIGAALYLIPSIIAGARHHRSGGAIMACNILLGWCFIGWVAALVWSLTGNVEPKT